ncbi:MAG: CoA-binding protein [Candidatus Omnitrophota bacterium]|jgi:predicted CoA-binding protein
MKDLINDFLKQKSFAVVGSFRSESKYAYKILKDLVKKGHEVFPVNPNLSEVEGRKCYKKLSDIPSKVDVVDIVTPPPVTGKIVRECLENSIKRVWLQPGAESEDAIRFCRDNGIDVIYGICLMLESE